MRFSPVSFLSLWALLVASVSARGLAGAYERVYFYLVYLTECQAYGGAGEGYFGQHCQGAAANRICNFNEFINYVNTGTVSENIAFLQRGSQLQMTDDAIHAAAKAIYDQGRAQTGLITATRLVPDRNGFVGLFRDAGESLDEAKEWAEGHNIDLSSRLDRARTALTSALELRLGDYNDPLRRHLQARVTNVNWATVHKDFRNLNIRTWDEIDWETTRANNPDMANPNSQISRNIRREIGLYQSGDPTGPTYDDRFPRAAQNHMTVIDRQRNALASC